MGKFNLIFFLFALVSKRRIRKGSETMIMFIIITKIWLVLGVSVHLKILNAAADHAVNDPSMKLYLMSKYVSEGTIEKINHQFKYCSKRTHSVKVLYTMTGDALMRFSP